MPWSGIASGVLSSVAGLAGGLLNNSSRSSANLLSYKQNKKLQERDQAFQREVYQNQYQWKASDAKKAGLHPLSIIGGGAYSASPSSSPSQVLPDDYSFLGKLGDDIGDAFTAYKTKQELAAEAAVKDERDRKLFDAQLAEIQARTRMYGANAFEATQRGMGYTVPWASGNEVMKGQVDSPEIKPMLQKFRKPDGTLTSWKPGNDYQEVHSDIPFLEFWPHVQAAYQTVRDILGNFPSSGDGYYYSRRDR